MDKESHFPLIRRPLNRNCDLPFLFKASTESTSLMDEKDEGARIKKYAELLMPLLFETWMEVRPAALNDSSKLNMANDDVHISNEAVCSNFAMHDSLRSKREGISIFCFFFVHARHSH